MSISQSCHTSNQIFFELVNKLGVICFTSDDIADFIHYNMSLITIPQYTVKHFTKLIVAETFLDFGLFGLAEKYTQMMEGTNFWGAVSEFYDLDW